MLGLLLLMAGSTCSLAAEGTKWLPWQVSQTAQEGLPGCENWVGAAGLAHRASVRAGLSLWCPVPRFSQVLLSSVCGWAWALATSLWVSWGGDGLAYVGFWAGGLLGCGDRMGGHWLGPPSLCMLVSSS